MENIIIEAPYVWEYFQQHKHELERSPCIIAEREDFGVVITLSNERGLPYFVVTADDYQYDANSATSKQDCIITVEELYEKYLTDGFINELLGYTDNEENSADIPTLLDQDDMISERELELDDAVLMFMDVVLDSGDGYPVEIAAETISDDVYADIKEHMLEYIARKHGVKIRRPMVLEDVDSGDDFFTEYPYECMEYEDEDNPIYKK